MLDVTLNGEVSKVLDKLEQALAAEDIDAVLDLFVDDGYWRDLISFTWNIKTMETQWVRATAGCKAWCGQTPKNLGRRT